MNKNVESHFSELPKLDIERSIFDRSFSHKTSFNVGELIPVFVDIAPPGSSFRMTTSKVVRLQTMLTPIMDNLYLDMSYWSVPMRLVWPHWKEFCGENNTNAWVQQIQYNVPTISAPATTGFTTGSLADYFGLPVGIPWTNSDECAPIALPFRAYAMICNEFWRDENLSDPLNIPTGDSNQTGTNGSNYINDVANGGKPFKVAKFHDRFTSCLPAPQKSQNPVQFPLLSGSKAPVYTSATDLVIPGTGQQAEKLHLRNADGTDTGATHRTLGVASSNVFHITDATLSGSTTGVYPSNLYADLTSSVGAVTVNELRLAFQLQRFYERAARSGSRYIEYLKGMFGVTAFDNVLQRPEYLGGNRIPLNVHEVTNSAQSANDFLGDLGAKSATSDVNEDFEKSFTEWSIVIGCACVRYDHSYSQGMERFWMRKDFFDWYNPVFASLGEMPVYQNEICATAANMASKTVFGYNEAWSDMRYKENRISGEMRPGIANTLASWHLGDYYATAPTLSDGWIREDLTNVDRCLAVTSSVSNQIFADFYFKNICTMPMPMYSIPGLIDHH